MRLHLALACAMVVIGGLMLLDQPFMAGNRQSPPVEPGIGLMFGIVKSIGALVLILVAVLYSFSNTTPNQSN